MRERRNSCTQGGIGSPVSVIFHAGGSGSTSDVRASRSSSAITCCVPTLLAGRRPERIQRRMVSGSRFTRRAASGTVNIFNVVVYNNLYDATALGTFSLCRQDSRKTGCSHRSLIGAKGEDCHPYARNRESQQPAKAGEDIGPVGVRAQCGACRLDRPVDGIEGGDTLHPARD